MGEDKISDALRLLTAEVGELQARLDKEGRLSDEEIARLNQVRSELKKVRGEWILDEIDRGTPQNRVAELVGVSPARITQILREMGR